MVNTKMKRVVIIGGGATGACVAINLYQFFKMKFEIVIIDPSESLGLGRAYQTIDEENLLNVAASNMGLKADIPTDFSNWLDSKNYSQSGFIHWPFVPRKIYGKYIQEQLSHIRFTHLKLKVNDVKINEQGFNIFLSNGSIYDASYVIISTGYKAEHNIFEHLMSKQSSHRLLFANEVEHIDFKTNDKILILGTGLTAIDVWKRLRRIVDQSLTMLSRRGLLPFVHIKSEEIKSFPHLLGLTPRQLFDVLRKYHFEVSQPWQVIADQVRLQNRRIWSSWNAIQKKQFIRHMKIYWEVIRHRLPESIFKILSDDIENGKLIICSGNVEKISKGLNQLSVTWRQRTTGEVICQSFDYIILATGAQISQELFSDKEVEYIKLSSNNLGYINLGIKNLWFAGPSSKEMFWEITAIPDIRQQAKDICLELQKEF